MSGSVFKDVMVFDPPPHVEGARSTYNLVEINIVNVYALGRYCLPRPEQGGTSYFSVRKAEFVRHQLSQFHYRYESEGSVLTCGFYVKPG